MQCLVEYLVVFVSLLAFNRNFEETQAKCIDVQLNEQIENFKCIKVSSSKLSDFSLKSVIISINPFSTAEK